MLITGHSQRRNRPSVPALLAGCAITLAVAVADMADRHHARGNRPYTSAGQPEFTENNRDVFSAMPVSENIEARADFKDELSWLNDVLAPASEAQRDWLVQHGYANTPLHADLVPSELARVHAEALAGHRSAIDHYAALAAMRGQADALEWLQLSAANGSTLALIRLAVWHDQQHSTDSKIIAQAWRLLAKQRGDPLTALLPEEEITLVERSEAATRAAEFYQHLENLRYRQGLPAFNNLSFPAE